MTYNHHPLDEGHFSYVAVNGNEVEIKVDDSIVGFNLQTAEEIVEILTGYVQDRHRAGEEFFAFIQEGEKRNG